MLAAEVAVTDYDLITVGGGLAGSALARSLAESGARVLVLERETEFRDRVRGEGMQPWGVPDLRALGLYDLLCESCALPVPVLAMQMGTIALPERNFVETSEQRCPFLDFFHPELQEVVLRAAQTAGAEVRRGATVLDVTPGSPPIVTARTNGATEQLDARLVVGADGRFSKVRDWAGFKTSRDPERLIIGGVRLDGMRVPEDRVQFVIHSDEGQSCLVFPLGRERFRAYYVFRKQAGRRTLSGRERLGDFVDFCVDTGAPREWYEGAEPVGPLASFEGADHWVDHPHREGVVLVGDAAAASDPSWGEGLSLTVRDVRVLRDALLATDDWEAAAERYAQEHDRHYGVIHTLEDWLTELILETTPEARARRERVLPGLARDPMGLTQAFVLGPETPTDEESRRRIFGDD